MLRSAHRGAAKSLPAPSPDLRLCDDMWTHLFAEIVRQTDGVGQIWRLGLRQGSRTAYRGDLIELRDHDPAGLTTFAPDVIFNRGGYGKYVEVLKACPDAAKIYYGAGQRWCPRDGIAYDLILVDSPAQQAEAAAAFRDSVVEILHKPAAPCFTPAMAAGYKIYDVVFICAAPRKFKGADWLAKRLPAGARVLRIGPADESFNQAHDAGKLDVEFVGPLARRQIPAWACLGRIGVVCDDGTCDSGPRVLTELIAMGIPVLVRSCVRADLGRIVRPETGLVVGEGLDEFDEAYRLLLGQAMEMDPAKFYREHLGLPKAAAAVIRVLQELQKLRKAVQ
ncbi:glycosyltransferase [bacterium]|nr:glycosyltransferase [bacterium]